MTPIISPFGSQKVRCARPQKKKDDRPSFPFFPAGIGRKSTVNFEQRRKQGKNTYTHSHKRTPQTTSCARTPATSMKNCQTSRKDDGFISHSNVGTAGAYPFESFGASCVFARGQNYEGGGLGLTECMCVFLGNEMVDWLRTHKQERSGIEECPWKVSTKVVLVPPSCTNWKVHRTTHTHTQSCWEKAKEMSHISMILIWNVNR